MCGYSRVAYFHDKKGFNSFDLLSSSENLFKVLVGMNSICTGIGEICDKTRSASARHPMIRLACIGRSAPWPWDVMDRSKHFVLCGFSTKLFFEFSTVWEVGPETLECWKRWNVLCSHAESRIRVIDFIARMVGPDAESTPGVLRSVQFVIGICK